MKSKFLLPICLLLMGCHTIRPSAIPNEPMLSSIPKIDKNVTLLLDQNYSSYISKDRGNALEDPQKYYVGEALAPLTQTYFEKAFSSVVVISSMPSTKLSSQYLIHPKVKRFENSITLSEQTITLFLDADIYAPDLSLIQTVTVQGSGRGEDTVFETAKQAGETVNLAIQNTLSNLLKEINSKLTKA